MSEFRNDHKFQRENEKQQQETRMMNNHFQDINAEIELNKKNNIFQKQNSFMDKRTQDGSKSEEKKEKLIEKQKQITKICLLEFGTDISQDIQEINQNVIPVENNVFMLTPINTQLLKKYQERPLAQQQIQKPQSQSQQEQSNIIQNGQINIQNNQQRHKLNNYQGNNIKQSNNDVEKIAWDQESTYTLDIFELIKGQAKGKQRLNYIIILQYQITEQIIEFCMKKFTFKMTDLLIFNRKQELSFILLQFNCYTQISKSGFPKYFGDKIIITKESPTADIIKNLVKYCTLQHNRQKFKYLKEKDSLRYKIHGIASRKNINKIYTQALFLIYDKVIDVNDFIEKLKNKINPIKEELKDLKKESNNKYMIVHNVTDFQMYIFIDFLKKTEVIIKDYLEQIAEYGIYQIYIYIGEENIKLAQMQQLMLQVKNMETNKLVWITRKFYCGPEELLDKKITFQNIFKELPLVYQPVDDDNCKVYEHIPNKQYEKDKQEVHKYQADDSNNDEDEEGDQYE